MKIPETWGMVLMRYKPQKVMRSRVKADQLRMEGEPTLVLNMHR